MSNFADSFDELYSGILFYLIQNYPHPGNLGAWQNRFATHKIDFELEFR